MKLIRFIVCFCLLILFGGALKRAIAASLPKSSQEMLKKAKLDPPILDDIDNELQVPKEWLERAKKEGKVVILSSGRPLDRNDLYAPFRERYPFIALDHSFASREQRTIKALIAYRSGRIMADVVDSVGGTFFQFKEAGALEDLRPLPTMKKIPEAAKDPEGLWVGFNRLHWCISYNTRLVKKEELPAKWENLLTSAKWRGGQLALGNRPNLWALQLWKAKGEKWTKDFLTRLATEVKPQFRKEGLTALLELNAAGEFRATIPANDSSMTKRVLAGAPLGFHCPEPAPVSAEELVILKGAPNINAAKIFVNWLLSKEGQISRFVDFTDPPVRPDLARRELVYFTNEISGKEVSYREPGLETEVLPKLLEFWNDLWLKGVRG